MPVAYNGTPLPSFLYGTAWKKEATAPLVEQAVSAGFRGIDTANQIKHYDEARVGEALEALRTRGVPRESLFLQTKFTPAPGQDHRTPYDRQADLTTQVRQSFESSLEHLRTGTIDSYVLHGPYRRRGLGTEDEEVWRALEEIHRSGRARMIGISNVAPDQLEALCRWAEVKPLVVQNRCFAALGWDRDVRAICRTQGIVYQGFSLLTANPEVLESPQAAAIASRLGATVEQVVFRFAQQIGILPLTGTTDPAHMREDLEAERLSLAAQDLRALETIASRI